MRSWVSGLSVSSSGSSQTWDNGQITLLLASLRGTSAKCGNKEEKDERRVKEGKKGEEGKEKEVNELKGE